MRAYRHTLQTGFVGLQVGCVPKGTYAVAGYGLLPNPQAARHAQVNQQHACVKTNQQVFGAVAAFAHHQPAQGFGQRTRDLPTQFGLADGYGTDGLVDDVRGDAAQGGFYFGEFGHGGGDVWFEGGRL